MDLMIKVDGSLHTCRICIDGVEHMLMSFFSELQMQW